jgi:hypothetical protein
MFSQLTYIGMMDFEFTPQRSSHFGSGWLLLSGEMAEWFNAPDGVASSAWNPTASEDWIGLIGLLGFRRKHGVERDVRFWAAQVVNPALQRNSSSF